MIQFRQQSMQEQSYAQSILDSFKKVYTVRSVVKRRHLKFFTMNSTFEEGSCLVNRRIVFAPLRNSSDFEYLKRLLERPGLNT